MGKVKAGRTAAQIETEGLVDVLYVGSDADLADMYRLKLELDGYRVRTLTTLRHWSGARPDLVFIDLEPPDGSGLSELTRLRSDRRLATVPAILLVAESAQDLEARGVRLRPLEYLMHARPSALKETWWQQTESSADQAIAGSVRST